MDEPYTDDVGLRSNIKLHQMSGWCCLQPAVCNLLSLLGYIMPPLSAKIHCLNSICSFSQQFSQNTCNYSSTIVGLMYNLVFECSWQLIIETITTKLVPYTSNYTLKNYCAHLLNGEVVISQVYKIGRLLSFRNKLHACTFSDQ